MKSILSRLSDHNFGLALRLMRKSKGMSQEAFGSVSSRTHIGRLERGEKGITLDKVEQLATTLEVHPLTLLLVAYSAETTYTEALKLWQEVAQEYALLQPLVTEDT